MKSNTGVDESEERGANESSQAAIPFTSGSGIGGGSRAGLFRTPISGGVQSATSAHDLPRPALAVRNLMEQVRPTALNVKWWKLLEDYRSYIVDHFCYHYHRSLLMEPNLYLLRMYVKM